MSRRKTARAEESRIPEEVEDEVHLDTKDYVPEDPITKDIHSLPDEMLVEVFSYLGHGDALCCRLVSKRWCNVITSWTGFKNSVVYLVKDGETKSKKNNSLVTLHKSEYCWPQVRFTQYDVSMERFQDLYVLEKVADGVVAVEFVECSWTWKSLKTIILLFQNLNALSIRRRYESPYMYEYQCPFPLQNVATRGEMQSQEKWNALVKKLRSLTLYFIDYNDMARVLTEDFNVLQQLVSLNLDAPGVSSRRNEYRHNKQHVACTAAAPDVIYQIICSSLETLETLVVNIPITFMMKLIRKLNKHVCTGDSDRNTCLNLTRLEFGQFKMPPGPGTLKLNLVKTLQSFVCTLINLVHCTLPPILNFDLLIEQQKLLKNLPRNLRSLKVLDEKYLFPNFLDMFPYLNRLEIANGSVPFVTTGKKYMIIRHLKTRQGIVNIPISGWVAAFPNLTMLDLVMYDISEVFDDLALQAIIKNLKMLTSLKIRSTLYQCAISDSGLTGIYNNYCVHLRGLSEIYDIGSHKVPTDAFYGAPLCSLTSKGLKYLSMYSEINISNVGIIFGLGFKELRFLELTLGHQVTNLGLDALGRLNPGLEKIRLHVSVAVGVTSDGLDCMMKNLPRVKNQHRHLVR